MRYSIFFLFLTSALPLALAGTTLHKPTSVGKDYYIVFPKAAWGNQSVGVLINSPTKQKITVTTPTGSKGVIDIKKENISQYYPGQFRIVSSPGYRPKEATRIQAPNPISIHAQFGLQGISGVYTPIPVTGWGMEYYAIAPPEGQNSTYSTYPTVYSVPSITIIASAPNTLVTCMPTASTSTGRGAGAEFQISLPNAGDVYTISTTGDPQAGQFHQENMCSADLSGTHLTSNAPIGVIVAQSHTTWPCGNNECGDYGVEWLPPVSAWDSEYVVTSGPLVHAGGMGPAIRAVFSTNLTDLFYTDNSGDVHSLGTFKAGEVFDFPVNFISCVKVWATHPVLLLEMGRAGTPCIGNEASFSMTIPTGVHQWSDYTPFCGAITGNLARCYVLCRYDDVNKISLNGVRLSDPRFGVTRVAGEYGAVVTTVNAAEFNVLKGDSGATVGGEIWGSGTLRFSPGEDTTLHTTLDPELIKSYSYPIGAPMVRFENDDSIAPQVTLRDSCGKWSGMATDNSLAPLATGIYDIYLASNFGEDTTYNMEFLPSPVFAYGDKSVSFALRVKNLLDFAQAALHIVDGAGNERDTIVQYFPERVSAEPNLIDVNQVHVGDSATVDLMLHNQASTPVTFTEYHLRYGILHGWKQLTPGAPVPPFSINPGAAVNFQFRYYGLNYREGKLDDDTLFVTTCKQFPVAALLGISIPPDTSTGVNVSRTFLRGRIESIFPNPLTSSSALNYTVATPGMVTIRMRNILGEIVQTILHEYRDEGMYAVQVASDGLAAGVYVVELNGGLGRRIAVLH